MSKTSSQSGFSLVETLVAITILLLVIVGPMAISTASSRSTSFGNEQAVAFMLAQEGVELIQKGRDDRIMGYFDNNNPTNPWDRFINTTHTSGARSYFRNCYTAYNPDGCGTHMVAAHDLYDPVGSRLPDCSWINNCALYLDTTTPNLLSRYRHAQIPSANEATTPYTRVIKMSPIGVGDQVRVVSTVTWRSGFSRQEQSVSVETVLFNVYGLP